MRWLMLIGGPLCLLAGCSSGRQVTSILVVEFRPAFSSAADGLEPLELFDTNETYYVSPTVVAGNGDIASVLETYDEGAKPAISIEFTAAGAKKMAAFTEANTDELLALVIDGQLLIAVPIRSTISSRAMLSGLSQERYKAIITLLTAVRVDRPAP